MFSERRNYRPFLLWCVSVFLIITSVFWAWYFGLVAAVVAADSTYLTWVIAAIFTLANIQLGRIAFWQSEMFFDSKELREKTNTMWFSSEQLMALGMLGTVIGLIHMMQAADGIDPSNNAEMASSLVGMFSNFALALYTNAVGLAASIVLKWQTQFIGVNQADDEE